MTHQHRAHRGRVGAGVLLALALTAPITEAATKDRSTFEARVAQVVWGSGDIETGVGHWGGFGVFQQPDLGLAFFWDEVTTAVPCDAGTPEMTDDYTGLHRTFVSGDGTYTSFSIDENLKHASASGSISLSSGTSDGCTGEVTVTNVQPDLPFTLDLVASGRNETWVDTYRERVPDEYSVFQVIRSRGYPATGTVTINGESLDYDAAQISRNSGHSTFRFVEPEG